MTLIVLGVGSCGWLVYRVASAPIGAANDWLALVDEGRFDEAYASLCPAAQGSGGPEPVVADLRERYGPGLDDYQITGYNNSNGAVTVDGTVTVTGGPARAVVFQMRQSDDGWQVCGGY